MVARISGFFFRFYLSSFHFMWMVITQIVFIYKWRSIKHDRNCQWPFNKSVHWWKTFGVFLQLLVNKCSKLYIPNVAWNENKSLTSAQKTDQRIPAWDFYFRYFPWVMGNIREIVLHGKILRREDRLQHQIPSRYDKTEMNNLTPDRPF